MKILPAILIALFWLVLFQSLNAQLTDTSIVDVVWLRDGSKLRGTILKWDLPRGMEFKLLTGAEILIPKADIKRVEQDVPFMKTPVATRYERKPPVKTEYAFKEKGWYNNSSGFINFSYSGGAGVHHAIGYRFDRMLGIGLGMGVELHDFNSTRKFIPIYAEARGFFFPKKVTPYYALKMGYGIGLKGYAEWEVSEQIEARGGFHFSPELGMRFGGGDVSYYAGVEYKIQNAVFKYRDFFGNGGINTDKISYRRVELRTGLLF
jgi:hypothetical protein